MVINACFSKKISKVGKFSVTCWKWDTINIGPEDQGPGIQGPGIHGPGIQGPGTWRPRVLRPVLHLAVARELQLLATCVNVFLAQTYGLIVSVQTHWYAHKRHYSQQTCNFTLYLLASLILFHFLRLVTKHRSLGIKGHCKIMCRPVNCRGRLLPYMCKFSFARLTARKLLWRSKKLEYIVQ